MPLELRKNPDGTIRPFWYGRFEVNGKRYCENLGIKVAGTPPVSLSLRDEGDGKFERSRATALMKLQAITDEARSKHGSARMMEKLFEMKTGEKMLTVKLEDLPDEWSRIRRKRPPNERYAAQCRSTLKRFTDFILERYPQTVEIAQVTSAHARAFLEAEEKRGVSGKTWNDILKLLRTTFRKLLPDGAPNPFAKHTGQEVETIFRRPFSTSELEAIIAEAERDPLIRPIIITGIFTAMRRGDCCTLRWKDVDLKQGYITVKTSKTGESVDIPIFPRLLQELESARNNVDEDEEFCFPEIERLYRTHPDQISQRVKMLLAKALKQEPEGVRTLLASHSKDDVTSRVTDYLKSGRLGKSKLARMRKAFELYHTGKSIKDVAAEADLSVGSVSGYLNELEEKTGCRIIRHTGSETDLTSLQSERKKGLRRASTLDFHSFRVTWITLALSNGVPLELVQRVTGHRTVDVVRKHYFRPGRENFKQALAQAMPHMLSTGPKDSVKQRALKILDTISEDNWSAAANDLRIVINELPG